MVHSAQANTNGKQSGLDGTRQSPQKFKKWCWITLGLLVLIYLSIAIPNFLRWGRPHNQAYAVASLRTLNFAAKTYASTYEKGFPPGIAVLGPPASNGAANPSTAGLIDGVLASGRQRGYVFTYVAGDKDADGRVMTYSIHADPIRPDSVFYHFFTDQTEVIRQERDRPANAQSSPIGQ